MPKRRSKRQQAIIRRRIFLSLCCVCLIFTVALISFAIKLLTPNKAEKTKNGGEKGNSSSVSKAEIPETFATVLSTGDIMVHSTQLDGAKVSGDDGYDFSAFFKQTAPYFKKADLSVANLEVTFGGTESGKYSGYPAFNTPDSLADVIKNSGINFLITANNHCYDTGLFGLKRTARVLKEKGMEFTGTRETADEPEFVIKKVNNINIGIANFTYETKGQLEGRKYLNGSIISQEANDLINTFSYDRINDFYAKSQDIITQMKSGGADFILFYLHWGNEYQTSPDTWQKSIAQKLADFGVNMIIGSHPHVIQPIQLIHPEGSDNSTICLYSTGNCISNQRQELMDSCPSGHTEDGMLFEFTLKKDKNGTFLYDLDLIPTWVDKYRGGSGYQYTVYPLENPNDASEKYSLSGSALTKAQKSYQRTKTIVSAGLTECQQAIGCDITFK